LPADVAGTSSENDRASALFEMLGQRSLSSAPDSKSSCRRTRGSFERPASPGNFAAMPAAPSGNFGGAADGSAAGQTTPPASAASAAKAMILLRMVLPSLPALAASSH